MRGHPSGADYLGLADINGVFGAQESMPTPRHALAAIREIATRIEPGGRTPEVDG